MSSEISSTSINPQDLIKVVEFWIGFGTAFVLIVVISFIICIINCCCCLPEPKEGIEITLEEEATDIAINGAYFSIQKEDEKLVLKQKPEPPLTGNISQRVVQSIGKRKARMLMRRGPRFSHFYSGNTSHDDELSNLNRELFRSSAGQEESDGDLGVANAPVLRNSGVTRSSTGSTLSRQLKEGMLKVKQQGNRGVASMKNMMSSSKIVEDSVDNTEADSPPPSGKPSRLLRKSPASAKSVKPSKLLRKSPASDEQVQLTLQARQDSARVKDKETKLSAEEMV